MICSYYQDSMKRWRASRSMFEPSIVVANVHEAFETCCGWLGTHDVNVNQDGNGSTIVTIKELRNYGKRKCKNGCPEGVDMRTCPRVENHTCPLLTWQGKDIIIGHKQQELFK